jgi:hypothetical protein
LVVATQDDPSPPMLASTLGLALVSAYFLVAFLRNRTQISVFPGRIEIDHGPVPLLPHRTLRLSGPGRLEFAQDTYGDGRATFAARFGFSCGVELVDSEGRRHRLVSNLTRRESERMLQALADK